GLIQAIADGTFGITKRPADKGKGLDGVVPLAADAYNPALELLHGRAGSGSKEVARA
ncbi:MAG: beta-lysine 5,6-aminomutase alpha subunit, partial [Blastococcus sp.]|nr:beta-lysine 5,6-aminomutase alpha subunit [Blastococcus sp.]